MADVNVSISKLFLPTHEGTELSLDPNDKGNWTGGEVAVGVLKGSRYGISAASYPSLDIPNLTEDEARSIYSRDYIPELYPQISAQAICNSLVDFGVTSGVRTAVIVLQRAIRDELAGPLAIDGVFGPETLEMTNASDADSLLRDFTKRRIKFYFALAVELLEKKNPSANDYFSAWLERSLDW